jgi:chromosome partitioning protein
VLGLSGLRRDWAKHIPEDAQRVVIDSAAGIRAGEIGEYLDGVDAVIVPMLPSSIDLEAAEPFLAELADLPRIKRGKVPVALVANRLKPWTNASQQAVDEIKGFPFPVVAELRDTQGYVLASALGKSIFDYNSELVRSHQDDWSKLLRWLKKLA